MDNLSQFLALGKSKKPTKAPVENSTEPVVNDGKRCLCRTEEGKQCKHPRKNGYFCAQHQDCTNPCILMETLPKIELKEPTTDSFILDGSRCLCLTKNGPQCKRPQDKSGTGFCGIHNNNCTRSVTSMSFKGEETAKSIISSASSISSTTKSVANQAQCQCIAESTGLQCEHDHKIGSIYCGHHQNCKKPIKPRQETVDIAKEEQDRSQISASVQSLKDSIVSGVSTTVGAVADGIQSILYVDKSLNAVPLQTPSIVMSMAKSIADDVKSLVITPIKSMVSGTELKIETNESIPQSPIQSEVATKTEVTDKVNVEVEVEFISHPTSQSTLSRKRKTNCYRLPDAKRITRQSRINAKEQVYQCPYMNKEDQPCIFFNKNTDKVCPLHSEDVVQLILS
jgi:hypothetical protein